MPKTKDDALHTIYPNAIGHNRIHRKPYYNWIEDSLLILDSENQARGFLNRVRMQLLQGNIRDDMVLQQEIDEAEYKAWVKKNNK